MSERIAVVTGATGGIGRDCAQRLSEAGFTCVGLDVQRDETAPWASYACDLADLAQVEAICATIEEAHGLPSVLVNAAGIVTHTKFLTATPEDFDRTIAVNGRGLYFLSQAVAKQMIRAGRGGSIVHFGSTGPLIGAGDAPYGMAKAGVHALTKSMAQQLGPHGIRVNALAPGLIETPMTADMPDDMRALYVENVPLRRTGTPADIGGVVAFLASDDAAYITGVVLPVNGGVY